MCGFSDQLKRLQIFHNVGQVKIFLIKAYYSSGVNISLIKEHHKLTTTFNQRIISVFRNVLWCKVPVPSFWSKPACNERNLNY
jgi:hypothetical protein